MNYPIQSLAIIAPIVFIVLMIIVPVIGVFAGWKRAAYWGGGTFFFFVVGVIVWKTAGTAIVNPLMDLIGNLLKDLGVSPTQQIVQSLASPVFFLLVMMVAELLLLINYYAWFKRVAKIKQDIEAKKEYKALKKAGKSVPKNITGWTAMQFTSKGKVINMACGGVGMALLLAPSTITFTQALMYTTTNSATRATNALCAGLYASLEKTASTFNWMSYYGNAETGKDFDSLLSTLSLYNKQVTYTDPTTGEKKTTSAFEAIGEITSIGLKDVVSTATQATSEHEGNLGEQFTDVAESVNELAGNWNALMDQAATEIAAIFQSENVTEMLEPIVKQFVPTTTLDAKEIYDAYNDDNSVFKSIIVDMKNAYARGDKEVELTVGGVTQKITTLESIPVSQESFDNIKSAFMSVFDTSKLVEGQPEQFEKDFSEIMSMVFYVA